MGDGDAYGRARPLLGRLFESRERDRSSSDSAAGFALSIPARHPVPAVTTRRLLRKKLFRRKSFLRLCVAHAVVATLPRPLADE